MQLAEAVGLTAHLPDDPRPTLQALFECRNKMFHCGFEWPTVERERFQKRTADWPSDWFATATSDHKPWIFYMTDTYINHCLTTIDSVLGGVGSSATVDEIIALENSWKIKLHSRDIGLNRN